jgi:N-acetylmuramoyl-L-alanine amidase
VPVRRVANLCGGSAVWDRYLGGAAVTSPDAEHDAADVYWLSRIISAESRGEEMEGQIAVGNVVLNRVAAEEFPDTIPAVIFDRKHDVQFTPVANGSVFLTPTAAAGGAAPPSRGGENTAGAALYFYAPALSQGVWINANRTYLMTIGCHRFYL